MKNLPRQVRRPLSDKNLEISNSFQKRLKKQLFIGEPMATKNPSKVSSFFAKNKFVPVGAAMVLVALVGVGTYNIGFNKSEDAALRSVELPTDLSGLKPIDEIRSLAAVGLVQGVSISSVELELEENVLVYKVKFSDGTFKLYNARTGEMVAKSDLEIDASVPANFVASVTIDSARATAQGIFPDKTVNKIELETENGIVVYSVRFTDDSRVDVSATDGSVVRTRDEASGVRTGGDSSSSDDSNKDSDDSKDSVDHQEEDKEDDGDRSGSNSGSGSDDSNKNQ
jgi:uncharacterized membrane protein YkoI